tara:strand:+ start:1466 stop:1642 length:177 start_codon:yes stop_codon:yes gene_type:complete
MKKYNTLTIEDIHSKVLALKKDIENQGGYHKADKDLVSAYDELSQHIWKFATEILIVK